MKKLPLIMFFSLILLASCSKDSIDVIGVEISGTSTLNGTYMLDKSHTKGPKYVNVNNTSKRLITYMDDGTEMWGLMDANYLLYKKEVDGQYPPESDWECGVGVDKDKFKCKLLLD
ncbi:hypothetical protein [Seonamhaeicola marinus]|uniref:Uncharacterized protein n=1 Tax=Seonamhaeicola marinus TaxID=1912246 RepID=A0A5D0J6X0_9FLAO|nr:hypothetical protein [Seonamhaeicola marinus]TYA92105.1 hypothetical protein FUA24_01345 [Seonamhaeicola marinus]